MMTASHFSSLHERKAHGGNVHPSPAAVTGKDLPVAASLQEMRGCMLPQRRTG
jgi:hypothetical protein